MAVTPETLREYGYGSESDWQPAVAQLCIDAAKNYLRRGGVEERLNDAEYDLAIMMLSMHWYDNRGVQVIGQVGGDIAKGVTSIIHQLANDPPGGD